MLQRSDAWYRARAGRITGSRFARAMAARNSEAYLGLVAELAAERCAGRSQDGGYVNAAMRWGINHEASARRWYERQHSCRVGEIGFVVHRVHDFVGVSPDGLVGDDGLVEIKCPQMKSFRKVMESRAMPTRYRWQVQGQLWVCGRDWLDFVCFYPPGQGIALRIERDEDDFDRLESRCIEVNRDVERRLAVGGRTQPAIPSRPSSRPPRWKPDGPALPPQWTQPQAGAEAPAKRFGGPTWVWIVLAALALWWLFR